MTFPGCTSEQTIVLWILAGALGLQLFYFLFFFIRIALYRHKASTANLAPVTVIVCARNEERHLRELIPDLLDQDYPDFEVVIVDDSSWDDTPDILRAFEVQYPRLRVITLNDDQQRMSGKKFAVTMGVKGAKHERLLFTDADCRPATRQWIREMTQPMNESKRMSLGYSPYRRYPGILNHLIRYDAFWTGLQYLSFAKAGLPYMGVGRNLGYAQSLFLEHGGFRSHMHVASGDDDLFVNEVARRKNTGVVIDPSAITLSEPKRTWREWWVQKRRHLTTGTRYRIGHKLLLTGYPFGWLMFHTALIWAAALHTPLVWIIGAWGLRSGIQIATFSMAETRMGGGRLAWLAPVSECFALLYTPVVMTANLIQPPRQWK